MLNIIIAYDNDDVNLGSYFTACKDDILGYLNEQIDSGLPLRIVEVIESQKCHSAYIDLRLNQFQNQPLLFVAYSHGLPHSLRCNNVAYVHSDNVHLFFNSILYTNACSTSEELGVRFDRKEGVYIGFSQPISAFKEESGCMNDSINCDNCGLKYGLSHRNSTFYNIFQVMKSHYSNLIDRYDEIGVNLILLSELRATRDALTIYGNTNKTFNQCIG